MQGESVFDAVDPGRHRPAWNGNESDHRKARLREAIQGGQRRGEPLDVRLVPLLLVGASPADEILSYVRKAGPELLVMGTHGRGAVARALLGSVASSVARRAACPLLLVPPAP